VTAMLKTDRCRRGMLLPAGLLLLFAMQGHAIETTNVQGIVYKADGTVAQGTLLVSWPSFTAADGSAVAAGSTTTTIAPDGSVKMVLAPNAGANPQGTYYTVVYHMTDGTVQKEYWVVPQAATATISQMRARVVPAAVAQQSVTQQYVDTSISALQGSFLQLRGGTMSGALRLSGDPTDAMQAATKEYVDAHAGGAQLPASQSVIAGSGNGGAVSMAEKGVTVTGTNGTVAWDEDLNAGIYDPRDPRWAGGVFGPTPWAAAQAMSNQMACDLAMGKVQHATAKWPQGSFILDQLVIAPGSDWEGMAQSDGGTVWQSRFNNHFLAQAPSTMTVTCSDGQQHTDGNGFTRVSHFELVGCAQGACPNAPGDTADYIQAGPENSGIDMATNGTVEYIYARSFGGYGIRVDGQDSKAWHNRTYSNDEWYYYGGYKGIAEGSASSEVNATTTGTTSSVALSWPAVTGANGYVIYRGTSPGAENSGYYLSSTNSFTDTGAAFSGSYGYTGVIQWPHLPAPVSSTAAVSATGGTLAPGTYYYKVVPYANDGWHGSAEFWGLDMMADWLEVYGLFDAPTKYTYHHIADIVGGGGDAHFDHFWPQLGLVGIAQPYGMGFNNVYEHARIDFARQEGFWTQDLKVMLTDSLIDGSCTSPNAATINTGQDGPRFAGECVQYFSTGVGDALDNVYFTDNPGFGPSFKTADILSEDGGSSVTNAHGASYQVVPSEGMLAGGKFDATFDAYISVTGSTPNVMGHSSISPVDSTPTTITGFFNAQPGQYFFVATGNSNVTIHNNLPYIATCSGKDINLGSMSGRLLFQSAGGGSFGFPVQVAEVCNSGGVAQSTIASSETVTFSATPIFSTAKRASLIALSGNVTSFTLAAGSDGQEKTLTFCQNATGGFSVGAPTNVRGFFAVGTTANKCSSQHFTYSTAQSAWLADSPGVINE
jgi:hypothetical protein